MKPSITEASVDDVGCGRSAPAPGAARDIGSRNPAKLVVSEDKRVLLIETDPCVQESIRYYLAEAGYAVVTSQNSRDALRAVMSGDFAFVLYDPTTPGLPPEKFYLGVRRIDSELCGRLVFLIGERNARSTSAFLQKIDGFVLRKPFDTKMLSEKIAATEVLGTLEGAFASAAGDPGLAQDCLATDDLLDDATPPPCATPVAGTQVKPSEETVPKAEQESAPAEWLWAPVQLAEVVPAIAPQAPPPGVLRLVAYAGLAVLGVLLVTRWSHFRDARKSAAEASAKQESIEEEWTPISRELQASTARRTQIEAEIRSWQRLAADRSMPRWSPALRSCVPPRDADIDILEVRSRAHPEDLGACEMSIRAVAGGSDPRFMAERFRQAVESGLKVDAKGRPASARLELVEDVPGAIPGQKRVTFLMIATVDALDAKVSLRKEGR